MNTNITKEIKPKRNLNRAMKDLFRVQKDAPKANKKARKKRAKNDQSQTSESGGSRDSGEAKASWAFAKKNYDWQIVPENRWSIVRTP